MSRGKDAVNEGCDPTGKWVKYKGKLYQVEHWYYDANRDMYELRAAGEPHGQTVVTAVDSSLTEDASIYPNFEKANIGDRCYVVGEGESVITSIVSGSVMAGKKGRMFRLNGTEVGEKDEVVLFHDLDQRIGYQNELALMNAYKYQESRVRVTIIWGDNGMVHFSDEVNGYRVEQEMSSLNSESEGDYSEFIVVFRFRSTEQAWLYDYRDPDNVVKSALPGYIIQLLRDAKVML